MIANRVLDFILACLAWIVVPIMIVTTFILGIFVTCSFGLLLLPLSLIWMVLIFPLIGASWLCGRIAVLRNPVGFIGIPLAVVADTYACLIPSMGELESRADKLLLAESWPFTWEYWRFRTGKLDIWSTEAEALRAILERVSRKDILKQRTVDRLSRREQLDSQV